MLDIQDRNLLFYDIEVFKEDSFVVFKDIDYNVVAIFRNDFTGLWEVIKDKILVGFNNYWYDDKIVTEMLNLKTPQQLKRLNDKIIKEGYKARTDLKLRTLDTFQQISVSRSGLKKIEGNIGKMILESSISFDIDRALTDDEYEEVLEYCKYDVDMVIEIWNMRKKQYFEPKLALLKRYGNTKAYRWNTTTISANMLLDKPLPKWSTHRVPEDILELAPPEAIEMWDQVNCITGQVKQKSCTVEEFDNTIQFGFGGLHSTKNTGKEFRDVILVDVGSLYPSIINNLDVLGTATDMYNDIRIERLEIKESGGDPVLSDALKLILNSVYGLLKNQYSTLHNPRASATVCIYGQIILYELTRRLSTVCEIVQINTDGVMFQTDSDRWKDICEDWEKEFNFTLDAEYFDLVIQRDVNNYIAVEKDTGYITTKGGDVARYKYERPFDNNSIRIIDIAIVNYLVHNKPILDTIRENLDKPELYQYILQAGPTYKCTTDEEDNEYNKVNRVFACKEDVEGRVTLFKKRKDDGLVRFADSPDNMFLWNHEIKDLVNFKDIIDLNWYYQLITGKLDSWKQV